VQPGAGVPVVERHVAATQLEPMQSDPVYAAWQSASAASAVAPFASHAWQVHVASLMPFRPVPVVHALPAVQVLASASASVPPSSEPLELVVLLELVVELLDAPLLLALLLDAPLLLVDPPELLVELDVVEASGTRVPTPLSSVPPHANHTALVTKVTNNADPLRRPILDMQTFLFAHASAAKTRRKFPGAPQQITHRGPRRRISRRFGDHRERRCVHLNALTFRSLRVIPPQAR